MVRLNWFHTFDRGDKHVTGLVARQIVYLIIFNTLVTAVVFFFLGIADPNRMGGCIGSLVLLPFWLALLWLIRRGHIQPALLIAVGSNFLLTVLQVWIDGGVQSPNFYALLVGIILAALAYGFWGVAVTGLLSAAAGYAFTFLQAAPAAYAEQEILWIHLSTFLTIAIYFYVSIQSFKRELFRNLQLTAKLATSESRLRRLIENLPIGALVTSATGEISLVNRRMVQLTGYGPETLKTANDWYRLLYPDPAQSDSVREQFGTLLLDTDHQVVTSEFYIMARSGSKLDVDTFVTRLGDEVIVLLNDITDRKKAEREVARKFSQLSSLRTLDIAIVNSEGLSELLDVFLTQISVQLDADAIWLMLYDSTEDQLMDVFTHGFSGQPPSGAPEIRGEIRRLLANPEPRLYHGARALTAALGEGTDAYSFGAAIPMTTKNGVVGILVVFQTQVFDPDADWLRFFEALAGQTAIGVERIHLIDSLKELNYSLVEAYDTTLQGWARALELRDKETEGHSRRVAEMTIDLARAVGVPEADLQDLYRGALLHDIGKMPIPDSILLKNGPLTEEEWVLMRQHPETAYHLLKNIPFLQRAVEIPYGHHEYWNGAGYPRRLAGEQIPLGARLFAIADVWDALSSDRPYRAAWPREKVIAYILERSGTQFDPAIITAFEKMMKPEPVQN
jgi:PAS domain S-box-containing protein/putative nucleotidyltransferase with HDIG domain